MNDGRSQSYQQLVQLDAVRLLPASWGAAGGAPRPGVAQALQGYGNSCDPCNGAPGTQARWYQYAPSPNGFNNYIRSQGQVRFQSLSRNAIGRLGAQNLLRTQPAVALSTDSSPWFNNSSDREGVVMSLGCGQSPLCGF